MPNALLQTYYWLNRFPQPTSRGNALRISEFQYYHAIKKLDEIGRQINFGLTFKSELEEREYLLDNCYLKLNRASEIHKGGNTRTIDVFASSHFDLKKIAEELNLPLPQDIPN